MNVKLELHSKNWSVFNDGNPLVLSSESVPRVGEIVDIRSALSFPDSEVTTFIVLDVTWVNEDGELTPYLKCHQWHKGDRFLELQEHGWTRA